MRRLSYYTVFFSLSVLLALPGNVIICQASAWAADEKSSPAEQGVEKEKQKNGLSVQISVEGNLSEAEKTNILNFLTLSRLSPNEPLTDAMFAYYFKQAEAEAATALEPFGLYNPVISTTQQKNEKGWKVIMQVDPGKPVLIDKVIIRLTGAGADNPVLMRAQSHLKELKGQTLIHPVYEQDKKDFIELAIEQGYLQAQYRTSKVEVWRGSNTAEVNLELDTGILYSVGKLIFDSEMLSHEMLERISPVQPGDSLAPQALTALRQTLYDSGYFATADVNYDLKEAVNGRVPLHVNTTPSQRNRVGFGLGYGTDTGVRGTINYANKYLNSAGHQLDVQLRPSQRLSRYGVSYGIPIGDPHKDLLTLGGQYETESFQNIKTTGWLGTLSRDHYWQNGQISAYFKILDEQYDTGMRDGHATMLIPGISTSLLWADNRVHTMQGLLLWGSVEGSDKLLLSKTPYGQVMVGAKGIFSFSEDWRVIGRGQFGATWVDDLGDLPPSLRLYAGGDQSVRGYAYKHISPRDEEDNIIGGRYLLAYSVELERVLMDSFSLAVFYDTGMVTNDYANQKYLSGTGFGIHWKAPFGRVRVDFAVPVDDPSLETFRIHLSLGTDL